MAKIHPSAEVSTKNIGTNTYVWQFSIILPNARIGDYCNINAHVFIENDVQIGDMVTIKSGVQIWDGVSLEDNVFIGPNVTFTNDVFPRSKVYPKEFQKTILKKGCSVGANSTIIAGIEIGEKALIGAGSVVTKSVPPFTLWYGNPARHMGYVTTENRILNLQLVDKVSGDEYSLIDSKPVKND